MNPYSQKELAQIQENFLKELKEAENGKDVSLSYITHEVPKTPLVKNGETFQIIVIGGSVFKKALLKKENDTLILLSRVEMPQPRFLTKEDFLKVIHAELDPNVSKVAVNFAYPMKPVFENGKLDGILLRGVKENTFKGLIDQKIGESIENFMKQEFDRSITVSVANDAICLLLSGLTQFTSNDIAGGIVGTGMNFALFQNENNLVNLEAANFNNFPQTDEGKFVDKHSAHPGTQLLEKEISGGYLYKQFNYLMEREGIACPPITSTADLDEMAQSYNTQIADVANMLIEKSAALVACVMSGIAEYKGTDTVFIMEGSLFWNANRYKDLVKETLLHLAPSRNITFGKVEDSPIYGGAKLIS